MKRLVHFSKVEWDAEPGVEIAPDFSAVVEFDDDVIYDEDAVADFLSDWLSDTYGFCHKGFIYCFDMFD